MIARFAHSRESLSYGGRYPTSTDIMRIRHTMKTLTRSEERLREKIENIGGMLDIGLLNDAQQHAFEINWGWHDLRNLVEELPVDFLDRDIWLRACDEGCERNAIRLEQINEELVANGNRFRKPNNS